MKIKKRYKVLVFLLLLLLICIALFNYLIRTEDPSVSDQSVMDLPRLQIDEHHYSIGASWLNKNKGGIWELYVEGKPYDRGVKIGHLSQELMEHQEEAFIASISEMVPANKSIDLIKYIIAWQNRNLQDYVPDELQQEIFGISHFLSDRFDFIADKFQRKLYYHAAHDIGHTVQNMGLIGCSAFAAWGDKTEDGNLLIGRNFDFYVGDAFAEQKLVLFMKPDDGIPFMSYSWPGMIGVVSGMNAAGLTVTLNAGPPSLPSASKMPVSILARKILQYAETLDEAIKIAEAEEIFVSEIFLIGSGKENKSILIEKAPDRMSVVKSSNQKELDYMVGTNHFQSDDLKDKQENTEFKLKSSTVFRNQKLNALLSDTTQLNNEVAVHYLRDWTDVENRPLGVGNEMSINQMIAHHSVVFKPVTKEVWVSTGASPMNTYLYYNLDSIFGVDVDVRPHALSISTKEVSPAPWVDNGGAVAYDLYKKLKAEIEQAMESGRSISDQQIMKFISLNPALYSSYSLAGQYWSKSGDCDRALVMWDQALDKNIPWTRDREEIEKLKDKCIKR